jgi:hypothetical protein
MQPTLSLYLNTNAPAKRIQFLGVDFTGSVVELVLTNLVTSEEITLSTADDEISIDQDIVVWDYDQTILEQLPVGNWTSFSVYRSIGETREFIGSGRVSIIANGGYQVDNGTMVINVPGVRGPAGTLEVDSVVTLDPDEDAYIEELGTNTESAWRVGIPRGYTGLTPDIEILSTTTLAAGQPATVTLDPSSTPEEPKLVFGVPKGDTGATPDISVLSTATLAPSQPATVTLDPSSTPEEPKLVFGVPRGDTGATGLTPAISVLSTSTLAPGSQATVALDPSSTPEAPKLNFGVPRGDTGDTGAAATIVIAGTDTLAPGAPATVVNEGTSAAASLRVGIPAGVQGLPGAPGEPLALVVSDTTDIGLGGWWVARDYHGAATCDYLRAEMLVGEADAVTLAVRKNGATVRSGIALGAGVTVITDLGLVLAEGDQVSVHRVGGGTLTGPWMMLVQIDGRTP